MADYCYINVFIGLANGDAILGILAVLNKPLLFNVWIGYNFCILYFVRFSISQMKFYFQ